MDTLMKVDLFFFITTIAVIVVGAVLTIALIYLIRMLKDLRYIVRRVKEETEVIIEDVQNLRSNIHKEHMRVSFMSEVVRALISTFISTTQRSPKRKKTKTKSKKAK